MPSTFADDDPVCHFIYPYVSGGIAWGLKKSNGHLNSWGYLT